MAAEQAHRTRTGSSAVMQLPLERIPDAVRTALLATGYPAVAVLSCEVIDGAIVLSGIVDSFYLKQVAQQAVLNLKQSQVLCNVIEVRRRKMQE